MATTRSIKSPSRIASGLSLWARWVVANLIGGFVGWGFAIIFASMTLSIGFTLSWIIIGGCLGFMQSYVLFKRERLFQLRVESWRTSETFLWIGSTVIGTLLSFISVVAIQFARPSQSVTADNSWRDILGFVIGGMLYGIAQWLVLRRFAKWFALWIVACALGWGIGAIVGLQIARAIVDLFTDPRNTDDVILLGYLDLAGIMVAGTMGIIVFGMITGIFLNLVGLGSRSRSDNPGTPQTAQSDPGSS
jgi:hypothetical protein